jgi:cystine transport system permease protein
VSQDTWDLLLQSFFPLVEGAIRGTIPLALSSFVLGIIIALGVALMRLSKVRVVSGIARVYVSIIRGSL